MKKTLLIVAAAGLLFASCSKSYTCDCVDADGNADEVLTVTYENVKKADAETACDIISTAAAFSGGSCTLK